jgi:hypothetical protein
VRGFAYCWINMNQARHVPVFFIGLGSMGFGIRDFVSMLLAPPLRLRPLRPP